MACEITALETGEGAAEYDSRFHDVAEHAAPRHLAIPSCTDSVHDRRLYARYVAIRIEQPGLTDSAHLVRRRNSVEKARHASAHRACVHTLRPRARGRVRHMSRTAVNVVRGKAVPESSGTFTRHAVGDVDIWRYEAERVHTEEPSFKLA